MTFEETIHYLYTRIPMFQRSGASAYKPGLNTSIELDNYLGNPHTFYQIIHVAGTNGKGSTSHLLAAILQQSGYKVGLYTSPHLIDFRERIRINGEMISKEYVTDFVERHRIFFEPLHPSFFELTSSMAFDYFRSEHVDFAIIEVGLGGRLDSTNIITPILSVITNISLDHTQFLGNTLEQIASEKAGIIKENVPVIIGESGSKGIYKVFKDKATKENASILFAEETDVLKNAHLRPDGYWQYTSADFGELIGELGGCVQIHNTRTVLTALRMLIQKHILIPPHAVKDAFEHVVELTGLLGRWQKLQENPTIICDTGHNTGGWESLGVQLKNEQIKHSSLRMIIGMVNDKDIHGVLSLMPKNAIYYFTQASVSRALPAKEIAISAHQHGLKGLSYPTVAEAIQKAIEEATPNDFIFIGGSTFIVADALPLFSKITIE